MLKNKWFIAFFVLVIAVSFIYADDTKKTVESEVQNGQIKSVLNK